MVVVFKAADHVARFVAGFFLDGVAALVEVVGIDAIGFVALRDAEVGGCPF